MKTEYVCHIPIFVGIEQCEQKLNCKKSQVGEGGGERAEKNNYDKKTNLFDDKKNGMLRRDSSTLKNF